MMGMPQMGPNGTGLSPHIQVCRPQHCSMARAVALGNARPKDLELMFGYSSGQISRIMGSPAFQAEVRRLTDGITLVEADMSANIRMMTQKAIEILDEDMEMDPVTNEHRRIRQNAALEVLNISGVRKAGGTHVYFQNNDNRQINVNELHDDEIRNEIQSLTRGANGVFKPGR